MVLADSFYYQPVQIDTINTRVNADLFAKEGDANGRGMVVQITENGIIKDTTGITLRLQWSHISVGVSGFTDFEVVDATKGLYKLIYPTSMLHRGRVESFIRITDNGILSGTRNLMITVERMVGSDETIEASDDFSALQTALTKLSAWEETISGKVDTWESDMEATKQLYIDTLTAAEATYPIELNSVKQQLEQTEQDLTAQLQHIFINVKTYGAKGDGITDDTDAIKEALNFLKPTGGVLYFPIGTYLSAPIDLTAFRNLIIRGYNSTTHLPYKTQTRIKMNAVGDVAIKCSDSSSELPAFSGKGITIENIYLDCNYKTHVGINMNLAVTVVNTCVRYADGDGIVFEGGTYPVELRRVVSQYNRGHGLRVKAPLTTVYNLYDCEFGFNDLYGVYVQDGSTCLWQNVLVQSNKQGGLKMVQPAIDTFTSHVFLERMTFINLYTEANGTLPPNDPNYDGNYGLKIEGLNTDPTTYAGKIMDLTFINCSINKSSTGETSYIVGTWNFKYFNSYGIFNGLDVTKNIFLETNYGTQKFTGLVNLSSGTAGRIQFPITQNKSSDVNTLDDYKEGSFTPTLGQVGGISFTTTTAIGYFVKVGKLVTCNIEIVWTDINNAPTNFGLYLGLLPYTITSNGSFSADITTVSGFTEKLTGVLNRTTKTATFTLGGKDTLMLISETPTSGRLRATISYMSD